MKVFEWPDSLCPLHSGWNIDARTKSGGVATNGYEQIVGPPNDIWRTELEFPINSKRRVRLWRALQAKLVGRMNAVWIRAYDKYAMTSMQAFGVDYEAGTPYDDDGTFDDGAPFAAPLIETPITANAQRHDAEILIDHSLMIAAPDAGIFISVGGWMYVIEGIFETDTVGIARVRVRPSLRDNVTAGDLVNYQPKTLVRFATDGTGQLQLQYNAIGNPVIQVEEVLDRNGVLL